MIKLKTKYNDNRRYMLYSINNWNLINQNVDDKKIQFWGVLWQDYDTTNRNVTDKFLKRLTLFYHKRRTK
jgi:hypothetical protein